MAARLSALRVARNFVIELSDNALKANGYFSTEPYCLE